MKKGSAFIAGLGANGSATARALARAGLEVIGCDAFRPPHDRGSSHGESRIIRAAYFEDPIYAPLAQRSFTLWRELESETNRQLLRITGGVNIGPRDGMLVRGALESARLYGVQHELLERGAAARRFPGFQIDDDHVVVFEPEAGILDPEACVAGQVESARAAGATLHTDEALLSWNRTDEGYHIKTSRSEYHTQHLILALGSWLKRFRPELPLQVTRQPVFWFEPIQAEPYRADRLPDYLIEFEPGRVFYGFPDLGSGVKCAVHHEGSAADADTVDRTMRATELAEVHQLLQQFLPNAAGPLVRSAVCLYTNTPDFHFIVDRAHDGPWLLSACSGHGFKFAPAIAELLANAIVEGAELPAVFSGIRAGLQGLVPGKPTE